MSCAAVSACVLTLAAATWQPSASTVTIVPGLRCAAELRIENLDGDQATTDYSGAVTLGGIEVGLNVVIRTNPLPDTWTALPPDGFVAVPPSVTVEEEAVAVIEICEFVGL